MNLADNLFVTLLKATVLATILFWVIIYSYFFNDTLFIYLIPSMLPIFIVCSLVIIVTITPFLWLEDSLNNKEIFKKYFPYYAIIMFVFAGYFVFKTNFEDFVCAFYFSAFFTLMQTWIWLCKPVTKNK